MSGDNPEGWAIERTPWGVRACWPDIDAEDDCVELHAEDGSFVVYSNSRIPTLSAALTVLAMCPEACSAAGFTVRRRRRGLREWARSATIVPLLLYAVAIGWYTPTEARAMWRGLIP